MAGMWMARPCKAAARAAATLKLRIRGKHCKTGTAWEEGAKWRRARPCQTARVVLLAHFLTRVKAAGGSAFLALCRVLRQGPGPPLTRRHGGLHRDEARLAAHQLHEADTVAC